MILHSVRYPRAARLPVVGDEARKKLLFLHGMGGTGALWRPIAAALEDEADLLCPDQRGHGESRLPPGVGDYAPLTFAGDIVETVRAEGFAPCWVIGHSMGVRTACGYAKLSPHDVEGLVLVDLGFSGLAGGSIGDALATFLGILPPNFPTRAEARAFLTAHCPDPSIAHYLLAVARVHLGTGEVTFPFDAAGLLATIDAARGVAVGDWMEAFARETGKPVHVLRGSESGVYSATDFAEERERYAPLANVQFTQVEDAGHGLPFEKRAEFVTLLKRWIGFAGNPPR